MKVLMIGGTGVISSAVAEKVLKEGSWLYLINRGNAKGQPEHPRLVSFTADIRNEGSVEDFMRGKYFDAVVDFVAFDKDDAERDFRLFHGRTDQYVFISSASIYQKPPSDYLITESTPLSNPYWEYSRKKIRCEEYFMERHREEGFPVTIVRPIQVYDRRRVPVGVHGLGGSWPVIKRIRDERPVILHGDGTSLWTFTWNEDFAEAFWGLLGNIRAVGQAVNIASDETVSWNQLYETIARVLGVQLNPVYASTDFLVSCGEGIIEPGKIIDKKYSAVFDNSKLKRLVPGYHSRVSMEKGVRMAVDYVMSHGECQTEDPRFDRWCDAVARAQRQAAMEVLGCKF